MGRCVWTMNVHTVQYMRVDSMVAILDRPVWQLEFSRNYLTSSLLSFRIFYDIQYSATISSITLKHSTAYLSIASATEPL